MALCWTPQKDFLLNSCFEMYRSVTTQFWARWRIWRVAEWVWLERWHGQSPTGAGAAAPFTVDHCGDLQQLRAKWQPVIDKRRGYLERLAEADLPRELGFKRLNGDAYTMPLVHQLQHVVNHATLHRGQVVGMIRQLGITPPATDLLFYLMAKPK